MSPKVQLSTSKAQRLARIREEIQKFMFADWEKVKEYVVVAEAPKAGEKLKDDEKLITI